MSIRWENLKAAESGWRLGAAARGQILHHCLQEKKARSFPWRYVGIPAAYLGVVTAVLFIGLILWPKTKPDEEYFILSGDQSASSGLLGETDIDDPSADEQKKPDKPMEDQPSQDQEDPLPPAEDQEPVKEEPPAEKPLEDAEVEEPKEPEVIKKDYLEILEHPALVTKEEMIQKAELIFKGKVLKKEKEYMTNPDGTLQAEGWGKIPNAQVAEYSVEIETLYKGTYESSVITVKTANGHGLSPDLILYGEDERVILSSPLRRIDLEEGADCILALTNVTNSIGGKENGYQPLYSELSYFTLDENGKYSNKDTHFPIEFSLETIQEEIAAVLNP